MIEVIDRLRSFVIICYSSSGEKFRKLELNILKLFTLEKKKLAETKWKKFAAINVVFFREQFQFVQFILWCKVYGMEWLFNKLSPQTFAMLNMKC